MRIANIITVSACCIATVQGFLAPLNSGKSMPILLAKGNGILSPSSSVPHKFDGAMQSTTALSMSLVEESNDTRNFAVNVPAAIAWSAALLIMLTNIQNAPSNPLDSEVISKFINDPVNPGLNEIFYFAFNIFAVMPIVLASLVMPQHAKRGIPAAPILFIASAAGFYVFGGYLAFRAPPRTAVTASQLDLITQNVWENKIVAWSSVLLTCVILYTSEIFPALLSDPAALWQDFTNLLSRDTVAFLSTVDITAMHFAIASLIPRDYQLRNPDAPESEGKWIALLCTFFPYLGQCLYVALRPKIK
jgi:hypothetical protein